MIFQVLSKSPLAEDADGSGVEQKVYVETRMKLTAGKLRRMEVVSNPEGVIAALAMDQRGALGEALALETTGTQPQITHQMLVGFKQR